MALKSKPMNKGSATPVPASELVVDGAVLRLPLSQIEVNKQVRTVFDEDELNALAEDIRNLGQIEPAIVRPHPRVLNRYILVAGERRYRACGILGIDLRVIVEGELHDQQRIEDVQWSENHHRAALELRDKAAIFTKDLARLGTQAAVAKYRGVSEATVSSVLNVSDAAQSPSSAVGKALRAGIRSPTDLNEIHKVSLRSASAASKLVDEAAAGGTNIRTRARESLRQLKQGAQARTGEAVANEIYALMGVGSGGQEFRAVEALSDSDADMLLTYLPRYNFASNLAMRSRKPRRNSMVK